MPTIEESTYKVTNQTHKLPGEHTERNLQVKWNSRLYPEAPLAPGASVLLPGHIAQHMAKKYPPQVNDQDEVVEQVSVEYFEGDVALQAVAAPVPQKFTDPDTKEEYDTPEALAEAMKARFMALVSKPANPIPAPPMLGGGRQERPHDPQRR